MNSQQTAYFMAIVGAIAGLACWTTLVWLPDFVPISQAWVSVSLAGALMGAFIGGMTVGFADYWTSDRVVPSWVLIGVVLGAVAGFLSGVLYIPISGRVAAAEPGSFGALVGRSLIWLMTGGLIGLVIGLRWVGANPLRAIHALAGGLLGGALGGLIVSIEDTPLFVDALSYMLTGTGITLGVTLAPMLLSDGVLRFVSSTDGRAQNKYGSPRQEWVLQDGDRLVIGSQSADMTSTVWSQDVQVYIPDAMVSRRHAVLFSKKKRFFVQVHPDNAGGNGQPVLPLQVGDDNVTGTRELRNGDELLVGQTLLRFITKRKQPARPSQQEQRRSP